MAQKTIVGIDQNQSDILFRNEPEILSIQNRENVIINVIWANWVRAEIKLKVNRVQIETGIETEQNETEETDRTSLIELAKRAETE